MLAKRRPTNVVPIRPGGPIPEPEVWEPLPEPPRPQRAPVRRAQPAPLAALAARVDSLAVQKNRVRVLLDARGLLLARRAGAQGPITIMAEPRAGIIKAAIKRRVYLVDPAYRRAVLKSWGLM